MGDNVPMWGEAMEGGPTMNETEYHQAIYEAAKKVIELHTIDGAKSYERKRFLLEMDRRIDNLEQALEGKET